MKTLFMSLFITLSAATYAQEDPTNDIMAFNARDYDGSVHRKFFYETYEDMRLALRFVGKIKQAIIAISSAQPLDEESFNQVFQEVYGEVLGARLGHNYLISLKRFHRRSPLVFVSKIKKLKQVEVVLSGEFEEELSNVETPYAISITPSTIWRYLERLRQQQEEAEDIDLCDTDVAIRA